MTAQSLGYSLDELCHAGCLLTIASRIEHFHMHLQWRNICDPLYALTSIPMPTTAKALAATRCKSWGCIRSFI